MAQTLVARVAPGISTFVDWLQRIGREANILDKIAEAQRQLEMFQDMPSWTPGREGIIRRAQERLDALRFGAGDFGPGGGAAAGVPAPLTDPSGADKVQKV